MTEDELHQPPAAAADPAHTTDPRVHEALRKLDALDELPPAEHIQVYEDVHATLQEVLADASARVEPTGDEEPAGGSET